MRRTLRVAPREIGDLVVRFARLQGLSPGESDRLAAVVTFGELQVGGAIAAALELAQRSALADFGRIDRSVQAALAAAMAGQRSDPVDTAGAPSVLLAAAAHEARSAGIDPAVLGLADDQVLPPPAIVDDNTATASTEGLEVDLAAFEELVAAASGYLVSEAILDAVDPAND